MAQRQIPQYYVYEHWRLDKDECFYVGKGKGGRAYETSKRGSHWRHIVAKLERIGSGYEVRLVITGLTEKEAFKIEKERIAFWRDIVDLANKTDGGEGVSGLKMSKEAKAKMRAAKLGKKPSHNGTTGMKFSNETKEKMRAAKLGKKPNNFGKKYKQKTPMSQEHKDAIAANNRKRVVSEETRNKLSLAATKQWQDENKRPDRNKAVV